MSLSSYELKAFYNELCNCKYRYSVTMYKIDTDTSRQSVKKNENGKCKVATRVMCGTVAIKCKVATTVMSGIVAIKCMVTARVMCGIVAKITF